MASSSNTNSTYTDEQLRDSISYACKRLGIQKPYKHQENALLSFLKGHDLIVALPTSAGKSLIFEAAPFCMDYLHTICSGEDQRVGQASDIPERHTALVVSPLKSLMNSQVADLSDKGVSAAALLKETTAEVYDNVENGKYSVVFASPEILQNKGPSLLSSSSFRERICGIFVDEVHVVKQWGHDGGTTKAFRQDYALLSELRSLVPSKVPVCALTATATSEIIETITISLALRDTVILAESPDRENIKLVVLHTKEKDPRKTFQWLAEQLMKKGKDCERHIVYCRSHDDCTKLYGFFERIIGRSKIRHDQTYGMYHATTSKVVQDMIINSFRDPNGSIRVLFATTAFGMGVDVKAVYSIIHYGPPKTISEYVQESGRAGRDSTPSTSVLIHYPGSTGKAKCVKAIKDFIKNDSECRRERVLNHFDTKKGAWTLEQHRCCDVCAKECTCDGESCKEEINVCELSLSVLNSSHGNTPASQCDFQKRDVTESNIADLQDRLCAYREACLLDEDNDCSQHLYSGEDIASGLPKQTIENIVRECNLSLPFHEFIKRYNLFNKAHATYVWDILQDVVGMCDIAPEPIGQEVSLPVLGALDVDPQMDEVADVDSEEELGLRAEIHSSSDSESD